MNYIKQNNELYQHFNSEDRFNMFSNKNNFNSLELITYPGKIQTWLGMKKSYNYDGYVWIKITNSFNDNNEDFNFHYYKGFYLSIIGLENTLLLQYNDPINNNELNGIINIINKLQYVKHFDFIINIIENIIKRKPNFIDK
jgi:hypothetical protein